MEMFKPELSLSREPDGEFTLHSTTLTPNSCFSAGFAVPGAPPGYVTIPEAMPIMLNIHRRDGICLMAIRPVEHTITDIRPGNGYTSVVAFAVLNDGAVVGQASITLNDAQRTTVLALATRRVAESRDWTATANLRPPRPDSLIVRGEVLVGDPGHVATLTAASPPGINPKQLILDLAINRIDGIWPQVMTWIEAVYRDGDYVGDHDTVLIRFPGGASQVLTIQKAY